MKKKQNMHIEYTSISSILPASSVQEGRWSCQEPLLASACTALLGPAPAQSIQKRLLALLEFCTCRMPGRCALHPWELCGMSKGGARVQTMAINLKRRYVDLARLKRKEEKRKKQRVGLHE